MIRAFAAALAAVMLFAAAPAQAMKIERVVSPGGIEAWLVQENEVPVIVLNLAWEGGSSQDPKDRPGVANMVSGLLDEGAGDLDSDAYQKRLEAFAAVLSFSEDHDDFTVSLKTLAEKRDEAFALLGLAVTQPRFDADAVERIRAQVASNVARDMEDPNWIASQAWFKAALGNHPYAQPDDGTPESVARITAADLRAYTKNVFARDNMKISVVGPISPKELGVLLDKTFGALPARAKLKPVPDVKLSGKPATVVVKRPFPQSVVVFGEQGLKRRDPDFVPAYVMNYVLGGGGFSARLTTEVREKRGLAYSVTSYLYPMRHAAFLLGDVGTKNASTGVSLAIIRKEFARMAAGGLTDKELADAKTYLTGSYPLRFDSNEEIAGQLLGMQQENLGIDYVDRRNGLIDAVTRADIARVAKRLLKSDGLVVAIVGEPDLSKKPIPPAGPVAPEAASGPSESAP
ncbi:MAG TPA: pitrilysin family protein [Parvibaculum sp.]